MVWRILPVEVGEGHRVRVEDRQVPHPGGGEVEDHGRAQAPGADHAHPGPEEGLLTRPADLVEEDSAAVPLDLGLGEAHGKNRSREK